MFVYFSPLCQMQRYMQYADPDNDVGVPVVNIFVFANSNEVCHSLYWLHSDWAVVIHTLPNVYLGLETSITRSFWSVSAVNIRVEVPKTMRTAFWKISVSFRQNKSCEGMCGFKFEVFVVFQDLLKHFSWIRNRLRLRFYTKYKVSYFPNHILKNMVYVVNMLLGYKRFSMKWILSDVMQVAYLLRYCSKVPRSSTKRK